MTIKAIIALDLEDGLGYKNKLPWPHNSEDMKWFSRQTLNSTVVMGKNTFNSLGKPLPDRHNMVVSDSMPSTSGIEVVKQDIAKSRIAFQSKVMPVYIIGGAKLLDSTLDIIDELYISRIQGVYTCDTYFKKYLTQFKESESHSYYDKNLYIEKWVKN